MLIAESMLPEFDHEMNLTRTMLERVPDESFDFTPHEKSYTLGRLAGHLATIPHWMVITLEETEFDVDPADGESWQPPVPTKRDEVLELFDRNVEQAREALAATTDEAMSVPWALKNRGEAIFEQPRVAVVRGMVFNHMIHHRAQLGVYYRLLDLPVPAIYGPSADEQG